MSLCGLFDYALISRRVKEYDQRHEFKSSGNHIKDKDPLGCSGEETVVLRRSYHGKTRTDIIERRRDGRENRDEVVSFECNDEHGERECHEIYEEIQSDGMFDITVNRLAVDVNFLDGPRMNISVDLSFDSLEHDLESCNLDTAAR